MTMKFRTSLLLLGFVLLQSCERDTQPFPEFNFRFESEQDLDHLKMRYQSNFCLSDSFAHSGRKSLKTVFFPGTIPVLEFAHFNRDWRGMNTLHMSFYNPSADTIRFFFYIDDHRDTTSYEDRFNFDLVLGPGRTDMSFCPEDLLTTGTGRPLSLGSIYHVIIHGRRLRQPLTLYLDDFYVE